nr:MAG TPA: hypothetical protein [Bacteriophage sp.]
MVQILLEALVRLFRMGIRHGIYLHLLLSNTHLIIAEIRLP